MLLILLSVRYKFDDERVTKEDVKRALEEQYGGEEEVTACSNIAKKKEQTNRNSNCYILIFVPLHC